MPFLILIDYKYPTTGDDETYYKEIAHVNALGIPMYNYEQTDGDGDLTGFIDWLDFLNNSDDEEFALKICGMVEIPSLLKNMVFFYIDHNSKKKLLFFVV